MYTSQKMVTRHVNQDSTQYILKRIGSLLHLWYVHCIEGLTKLFAVAPETVQLMFTHSNPMKNILKSKHLQVS